MKISYVPQANIDKQKWDNCVDTAGNGLIYVYSFYLDAMSKNWDALIMSQGLPSENVYEAVMPLTWNKKYGIYYLYQPFFAAHLGIFGNNFSSKIVELFLKNIPSKFKYWDFYLNNENLYSIKDFPMYERSNYVLNLDKSYEDLNARYAKSHSRNIKRAKDAGYFLKKNIPIEDIIFLAKEQAKKFSPITDKDYENLLKLFVILQEKNMAVTYGIYSAQQHLVASCAWFFSHNRAYYILVGNHPDGRTSGASHLLIDCFIREYAGKKILLDFEGSDIKNLAWFYSSFGALLEKYPGIKMNNLPSLIKLFKK
ncbi:MAG: hypothetical protein ABI834_07215 [Ginsengibacter sp.]